MEPKDELQLLTESLSGSEKRYLRIRLDREGDEKLVRLFSVCMESDAKEFPAAIKAAFPDAKVRSRLRRKLYEHLLDGLADYELKYSPDLRLYRSMQRSRVLLMRGLHQNADRMLGKALEEAEKFDRKGPLALISELRCNLEGLQKATRDKEAPRDALFQHAYLAAKEHAELRSLYYKDAMVAMTFNHEGAVGEGAGAFLASVLSDAETAVARPGFFFPYLGLHIMANVAILKGDDPAQRESWDRMAELFEEHPQMIPAIPDAYIRVLHYRSLMAISAGDANLAREYLDTLREQKPSRSYPYAYWFQLYYCTLGQYAMNVGDEAALRQFLEEVPGPLAELGASFHGVYALLLRLLMAVCHFLAGNYRAALHWVHENLNYEYPFAARKSAQILAILRLLVYVETGDLDTLENMVEKTRSLLGNEVPFPRFWEISRKYFGRLTGGREAQSRALEGFVQESEALFAEPAETNVPAHFDFPAWGRARLAGLPMREYIALNFGKRKLPETEEPLPK